MTPGARAKVEFTNRFGGEPEVVAAAPGRINLIGEHTDYSGGFALPIAIDRAVVVAASRAPGERSTLIAADLGLEHSIDLTQDLAPLPRDRPASAFANYVLGVVSEFRSLGLAPPNMKMVAAGDLPIGAGLSSSAAVEVATATALEALCGGALDPMDKALLCQRAEHVFPGTPCGIMDMYVSVFGRAGSALLIDCQTNQSAPIVLPPQDEMTILVINTGVRRELASSAYAERRAACERAARALGIDSLRTATIEMIDRAREHAAIDTETHQRASHVVLENVRTLLAAQSLEQGDVAGFAAQLFESHKSLRNLYEVSCPELDLIVDTAHHLREELGEPHIGARMTGGGFGGCAIACAPAAHIEALQGVIQARFAAEFDRTPESFTVAPGDGAARLAP